MRENSPVSQGSVYLDKHLEPHQEAEPDHSAAFLLGRDLGQLYGESGSFKESNGRVSLEFECHKLSPETIARIRSEKPESPERPNKMDDLFSGPLQVIDELRLARADSSGQVLDLGDILLPGHFCLLRESPESDLAFASERFVVIDGDLRKISTLASLFHELGHAVRGRALQDAFEEKRPRRAGVVAGLEQRPSTTTTS